MRGTIVFFGDRGTGRAPHTSKATINGVIGLDELKTLRTALAGFTTCNLGKASVVDRDLGDHYAPGNDTNVDERAVIYMKDNTDDSMVSITVAGWDTTGHPLDSSAEGDRIAGADVQAITTAINTATGKSLVPYWGKHIKVT